MRRRLIITLVLVDLTAPAVACPPLESCVVRLPSTNVSSAHRPEPTLLVRELTRVRAPRRDPNQIEMPWIWQALRAQVYSRMPSYEADHSFKLVLAPVVVTSPSDTVPGVGIAGDF